MQPLALYIHWPFCRAKCPYCDFNSHVRDRIDQARFATALRRELAWEAARLGHRPLASIFFGGGTPSLMDPDTAAALIADATALFPPAPDLEITLEANPTSVERAKLEAFRAAGVNRLSLGIQSLDDAALRSLGREHSATEAVAALEHARATFPRLSFDLIYARPGQSRTAWAAELNRALSLAADHLSLYQLTIEPGTQFEALHRQGRLVLPDEDTAALLYRDTIDTARTHGLEPYEVSNFARPGAESRHNLAYWRYADYAGIGPGAHGRLSLPSLPPSLGQGGDGGGFENPTENKLLPPNPNPPSGAATHPYPSGIKRGTHLVATRRHRAPEPWAELVEQHGHGTTAEDPIAAPDRAREMLLMGLRLAEGIAAPDFAARTGIPLMDAIDPDILNQAIDADYLTWQDGHLAATLEGRLRLDALLGALVL